MNRTKLVFSEAFRSIRGNVSASFAATTTVLIGMFLLGLFIALGTWVLSWSDHVKSELEVKVFFTPTVSPKQVNAVRVYIDKAKQRGDVADYVFISSAEALRIMRKREPTLTKDLTTNPLPASYVITPSHPEQVKRVSKELRHAFASPICKHGIGDLNSPRGVECVKDGEQTSKQILKVARYIEAVFFVAVLTLLAASMLLIANTIRLSIHSRRREIEVMKLVGATNWFVRGPFIVEGVIVGAIGSAAAVVVLLIGKRVALPAILPHLSTSSDIRSWSLPLISFLLLGLGILVGALGSGMTLRKHLRV